MVTFQIFLAIYALTVSRDENFAPVSRKVALFLWQGCQKRGPTCRLYVSRPTKCQTEFATFMDAILNAYNLLAFAITNQCN